MGLVSCAGQTVTSGAVHLPKWGCWFADVELDGEHTLSGQVTTKLVDLDLVGTVLSGGVLNGRSSYRIVGGKGGLGKALPKKSYSSDAGVRAQTVLTDAANDVGEAIDVASDWRLGPHWTRPPKCIAADVLHLIAPQAWYMGEDGRIRTGARAGTVLAASVPRASKPDLARGIVTLAPASFAALVPGITVDGIEAVDVHHDIRPSGIRTTIYGAQNGGSSRRLSAWQNLFNRLDPFRKFRSTWEYRVVTQEGERLNLQPVKVSTGMPDLRRVPVRPGIPGAKATVALAAKVLVSFVDEDPGRPFVSGFEDADGSGFIPVQLSFAEGVQGIARMGDTVQAGPFSGVITSGSLLVRCG